MVDGSVTVDRNGFDRLAAVDRVEASRTGTCHARDGHSKLTEGSRVWNHLPAPRITEPGAMIAPGRVAMGWTG